MDFEQLTDDSRKKLVERQLSVNCHVCGAFISCPSEADFWTWLKDGDVMAFYEAHRAHGSERSVGAEIKFIEKE